MALIPIITIPNPVLRKLAAPVPEITDGGSAVAYRHGRDHVQRARELVSAAPQINISQRLIVMDCGIRPGIVQND